MQDKFFIWRIIVVLLLIILIAAAFYFRSSSNENFIDENGDPITNPERKLTDRETEDIYALFETVPEG